MFSFIHKSNAFKNDSTTCTICSNEVEMFIKEKKKKARIQKITQGWNQNLKQFSKKNVIANVLTDYMKRCKWMS